METKTIFAASPCKYCRGKGGAFAHPAQRQGVRYLSLIIVVAFCCLRCGARTEGVSADEIGLEKAIEIAERQWNEGKIVCYRGEGDERN